MVEPFDIAMPEDHPLAQKTVIRPADVVGASWIGSPVGYPYDRVHDALAAVTGRAPRIVQRVMDNLIVEALVAAGVGLAILPRFTTRSHGNGLVTRPIAGVAAERQISAILRADRAARPSVRRVVQLLREEAAARLGAVPHTLSTPAAPPPAATQVASESKGAGRPSRSSR